MTVALEERGYLIWALMSAEEFSKWKAQGGGDLDAQLFLMALIEYLLYARALLSSRTPQTKHPGCWLWAVCITSPTAGLTIHSRVKAYFVKRLPTLTPAFRTLGVQSPGPLSHVSTRQQIAAPGSGMDDLGSFRGGSGVLLIACSHISEETAPALDGGPRSHSHPPPPLYTLLPHSVSFAFPRFSHTLAEAAPGGPSPQAL